MVVMTQAFFGGKQEESIEKPQNAADRLRAICMEYMAGT
jgi:hypothetical protein